MLLLRCNNVVQVQDLNYQIKTMEQFAADQKSGTSDVSYVDSLRTTHGTETDILLLFDGIEAYFGDLIKDVFDVNMFFLIRNKFIYRLNTLPDELSVEYITRKKDKFQKQ